jgi:fructose-1,6-bisphosphatase II / sedoheptulose-1,7-bisphosphatase
MGRNEIPIDRILTMEIVRATEHAAIAAARHRGAGDEPAADMAAARAMFSQLNRLPLSGRIVVGEGEQDETDLLHVGQTVGTGEGDTFDIAVDALEGNTLCAKSLPNALSVAAIARRGCLLATPNVYMQKIAIGPGYGPDVIDIDAPPVDNLERLAKAKGVRVRDLTACILDRPRHANLVEAVREAGASIRLIGDGDVAGIIHASDPDETGIDIYLGSGSAPAGVLAAAALRCTGGQMQGRLILDTPAKFERAAKLGIEDPNRVYKTEDMARGDILFAATGVTKGSLLEGVRFRRDVVFTHSLMMRSASGTIREIRARHRANSED